MGFIREGIQVEPYDATTGIGGVTADMLDIPKCYKQGLILDAHGLTIDDARVNLRDGRGKVVAALRIPLREIVYLDEGDAADALLESMGYGPEEDAA